VSFAQLALQHFIHLRKANILAHETLFGNMGLSELNIISGNFLE
jgi:hypothetical protein